MLSSPYWDAVARALRSRWEDAFFQLPAWSSESFSRAGGRGDCSETQFFFFNALKSFSQLSVNLNVYNLEVQAYSMS